MRAVIALALLPGCFTTWAITQGTGTERIWDEKIHEESVPLPGVEERLTVTLPLVTQYEQIPSTTANAPPVRGAPKPFAIGCAAEQHGHTEVYHSAFRYGSFWKKSTVVWFLLEGAAATAFLLTRDGNPGNVVYGGLIGADALGTAALLFAPRKEIYRKDDQPETTAIRSDCPDGLMLDIAGTTFPIDAAGRVGELGDAALDEWMAAPTGPMRIDFAGQTVDLPIGSRETCAWQREHHHTACAIGLGLPPQTASTTLLVPTGTLTRVAVQP